MRNILKCTAALLVLTSLSATPVLGKTYKCRDAEGNTVFSDTACNALAREEMKLNADKSNEHLDKDAISNCLAHLNHSQQIADPAAAKVARSQFDWVAVKGVGSRRLLTLELQFVNSHGIYARPVSLRCLMMGDGRTVSTYPYELLGP